MTSMEELPETLIAEKLKKYMKTMMQKSEATTQHREDPEKYVIEKASDERAVELLEKLKLKYPSIYSALINELYKLLKSGKLRELSGYDLYMVIQGLGLDIKPDVKIKFVKHGKEVDFKDYVKS